MRVCRARCHSRHRTRNQAAGVTANATARNQNGTVYYYKVAGANAGGVGAQSAEVSATPSSADLTLSNLTLSSGTWSYQAGNSITAQTNVTINGTAVVTFRAGSFISLKPGFSASAATASPGTTTFRAVIGQ